MKITNNTDLMEAFSEYPAQNNFATRTIENFYKNFGIKTVGEALHLSHAKLHEYKGVGNKAVLEFRDFQGFLRNNMSAEPVVTGTNSGKDKERLSVAKDILVAIVSRGERIDPDEAVYEAVILADKLINKLNVKP